MDESSEVVLIGGRSGVGKSSVASEMVEQLSAARIRHAYIEGDNLDLAWPPPWQDAGPGEPGLAERNLAAMWANYTALGYHRLIYSNTVSVCWSQAICAAMGDGPRVVGVLLTAGDGAAQERLVAREIGSGLTRHVETGRLRAVELAEQAPDWVHRVATDGRSVVEIATEVVGLTGWAVPGARSPGA